MSSGNREPKILFQGEMMTCCMCGKQLMSDPKIESGWTGIEYGDKVFYVCPDELPKPNSGQLAYRRAYLRVFEHLAKLHKKA